MTNLNFEVDSKVHAGIKILAIKAGKKMDDFLNGILRTYVKENAELLKITEKVDSNGPNPAE